MKQHSIANIVRMWFMDTVFDNVYTRYYQLVLRLATGWTVQGWNPGVGEISCTRPVRPWGPPSLLYSGYLVFPEDKAAGAWNWPPTPSSTEVKERVVLHFYSASGPSWPFFFRLKFTFSFTFTTNTWYLHIQWYYCNVSPIPSGYP